ncbi:MAG TPA: BLUF domain-containing protein [Glaciihabitans sp.]|nr:BLUF domain-containing protein [Glaciihabitans sp.]
MLSLVYVSVATSPMTDEDILRILAQSRANNKRDDVTGALLYRPDRFIQILEGPDDEVRKWFGIIQADPRHRNVQTISEKQIVTRQFPEWTMGFKPATDDAIAGIDGFEDFFRARTGLDRIKHAENEAQQMLEWLAEYWMPRR